MLLLLLPAVDLPLLQCAAPAAAAAVVAGVVVPSAAAVAIAVRLAINSFEAQAHVCCHWT